MSFLAPPALRQGDRVAVVAPAGPFDRPAFDKGLAVLARRYQPVFTERIFDAHRYLAGPDSSRGADLQHALDASDLTAIFCARGGYGSSRLLPSLRWGAPKLIVGFSDVTSLHLGAHRQGWRSLHAPVLTQLGNQPEDVIDRLFTMLEGGSVAPLSGTRTVVPGVVEGPLLGGNFSVLTRLLGTPWMPDLRGAVLLLEDVGERPYRLDRMWEHLLLSGALTGVKGIVFGEFTGCEEKDASYTSDDVLDELAAPLQVPTAAGFRIGHGTVNQPITLGAPVRLDATSRTLTLL